MRTHPLRPTLVLILACLLAVLFFVLGVVAPQANFHGGFLLPIVVAFLWGRRGDIYIVAALASMLALITFGAGGHAGLGSFLVNQLLPLGILRAAAWLHGAPANPQPAAGTRRRGCRPQSRTWGQ